MPIIKHTETGSDLQTLGQLPDQFVSEKKKQSNDYIKKTLDYLGTIAHSQVIQNNNSFVNNYNLVKGILRKEDFFMKNDPVTSFVETLTRDVELPDHVQHYSILNAPLNIMLGEQSKRPDFVRVKAYDDDSKSEELSFRTDILKQYILQEARQKIMMSLAVEGEGEPDEEQVEALTLERVEQELVNYTSMAERWANRMLTLCKAEFNFKELSEEAFRDLLISGREYFHVFEDNTKTGFGVEVLNPREVWKLKAAKNKYTSDQSGRNQGAYAIGTLSIMELSEIIQRFNLPKEEIDHLRKYSEEWPHLSARPSNFNTSQSGQNTIKYDVYSPLLEEERLKEEAILRGQMDVESFLSGSNSHNINTYHNKFVVLQSYHIGKIKVGMVRYIDEEGNEQSMFVDESYEEIPTQIGEVEWTWANQWYKGLKIGHEVYHLEPYKLLDYCPIIGVVHDEKNVSEAKSFIDLLKNFQTIYNVCVNQVFKLLEKEYGNVLVRPLRQIAIPKDGDGQDALELAEQELRATGVLDVDDSPENVRAASNQLTFKSIDLTRSNEIASRWNLAVQMKYEAWELVGISRARQGSIQATQTATGTQTEMTQSYAQTEPYFVQHEYLVAQVYQALIDAAQFIAIQRPESTLSFATTEGEQAFLRINTEDLKMRDLKLFVTSRAEDQRMFEELRQLAQPMLQNGASIYDVSVLYTTNSVRQMKDIFKALKDKQEAFQQQAQQLQQAELQQNAEGIQMQLQAEAEQKERERQHDSIEKQLDRLSKERIAIISATGYGQVESEDLDADSVPDVLEASRLGFEQSQAMAERQMKLQERQQKQNELLMKNDIEREKLKNERLNMKNDLEIEKIRLKAAKAKKPASPKKK
jgi:hypothetical protein